MGAISLPWMREWSPSASTESAGTRRTGGEGDLIRNGSTLVGAKFADLVGGVVRGGTVGRSAPRHDGQAMASAARAVLSWLFVGAVVIQEALKRILDHVVDEVAWDATPCLCLDQRKQGLEEGILATTLSAGSRMGLGTCIGRHLSSSPVGAVPTPMSGWMPLRERGCRARAGGGGAGGIESGSESEYGRGGMDLTRLQRSGARWPWPVMMRRSRARVEAT